MIATNIKIIGSLPKKFIRCHVNQCSARQFIRKKKNIRGLDQKFVFNYFLCVHFNDFLFILISDYD